MIMKNNDPGKKYRIVRSKKDRLLSCLNKSIHFRVSFDNCYFSNIQSIKGTTYTIFILEESRQFSKEFARLNHVSPVIGVTYD